MASQEDWEKVHEIKDKYCSTLLQNAHVNYVGVSLKKKAGKCTDTPTIVVAVKKKLPLADLSDEEKIPAFLDGIPTDVIEDNLNLMKLGDILQQQQQQQQRQQQDVEATADLIGNVNPYVYSATVTSCMAMAKYSTPLSNGTVGCFVRVTGNPKLPGITVGNDYLVTCQHVVEGSNPTDRIIIPAMNRDGPIPPNYDRAEYINGADSTQQSVDVAAVKLDANIAFRNEVPTANSQVTFAGVLTGWPTVGMLVFKYGSTTWYKEGEVTATNVSAGNLSRIIIVEGKKISSTRRGVIADQGDSGSVYVPLSGNSTIVGQLFSVDLDSKVPGGYTRSYGYRMDQQLNALAGNWRLS